MKNEYLSDLKHQIFKQNSELMEHSLKLAEFKTNINFIIEIVEKITEIDQEMDFLVFILEKALNLIPEADYGRIVIDSETTAYFLEKIYQKNDLFLNYNNFFDKDQQRKFSEIDFKSQGHQKKININFKINKEFLATIILYIEKDNTEYFSQDSIKMASFLEKILTSYLTWKRYQSLKQKVSQQTISSLTNLLSLHDDYTKAHNQNVAILSKKIAEYLKLSDIEIKNSYRAGLLHDIGKALVPLKILNKTTKLTEKEFSTIQKHPVWGYQILKEVSGLEKIAEYVLFHHEKWDGSGYPKGLRGPQIPLITQIVNLADAWDAMCSDRPYRKAMPKAKALAQIKKNKAKQFSPKIVEIFLKNLK